jgi:hypothetical protein
MTLTKLGYESCLGYHEKAEVLLDDTPSCCFAFEVYCYFVILSSFYFHVLDWMWGRTPAKALQYSP